MVGGGAWVGAVEAPAGLAFGVGAYDGDGKVGGLVFEVADEVYAVGKGAEESCAVKRGN